jgi:glyoxylase-like metal-dependent hydrolase (beta-lactamase superfamily II)
MQVERASDDIYIFTSDRYAQVTASLIISNGTGVLIDTMLYPSDAARIALHARQHCPNGVRYVIYTGHEADHTYGAFLYPRAEIIAHEKARDIMIDIGPAALAQAKESLPEMQPIKLRPPTITFAKGTFTLRLPGKTLEVIPMPGHTADGCSVLLHEERILFAGDAIMALPTIVNGDIEQLKQSIERIAAMQLEYIVQGHGELILRGEIKDTLRKSVLYLENLQSKVQRIIEGGGTREEAKSITVESCGLSRVLLNGAVTQLHTANTISLFDKMLRERPAQPKTVRAPKIVEPLEPTVKPRSKKSSAEKPPASGRRSIHSTVVSTIGRPSRTV